ncbi:hypothetical protein ABT120_61125 [Nonomuraea angiospora]|uniref:hypothetical protein n=1 Tax=Nonomuraea angiospora TaxID=46172 RepID=UPI00331C5595
MHPTEAKLLLDGGKGLADLAATLGVLVYVHVVDVFLLRGGGRRGDLGGIPANAGPRRSAMRTSDEIVTYGRYRH